SRGATGARARQLLSGSCGGIRRRCAPTAGGCRRGARGGLSTGERRSAALQGGIRGGAGRRRRGRGTDYADCRTSSRHREGDSGKRVPRERSKRAATVESAIEFYGVAGGFSALRIHERGYAGGTAADRSGDGRGHDSDHSEEIRRESKLV